MSGFVFLMAQRALEPGNVTRVAAHFCGIDVHRAHNAKPVARRQLPGHHGADGTKTVKEDANHGKII